jgi:hypothetical protein
MANAFLLTTFLTTFPLSQENNLMKIKCHEMDKNYEFFSSSDYSPSGFLNTHFQKDMRQTRTQLTTSSPVPSFLQHAKF